MNAAIEALTQCEEYEGPDGFVVTNHKTSELPNGVHEEIVAWLYISRNAYNARHQPMIGRRYRRYDNREVWNTLGPNPQPGRWTGRYYSVLDETIVELTATDIASIS